MQTIAGLFTMILLFWYTLLLSNSIVKTSFFVFKNYISGMPIKFLLLMTHFVDTTNMYVISGWVTPLVTNTSAAILVMCHKHTAYVNMSLVAISELVVSQI
jgi:hypothetical protein